MVADVRMAVAHLVWDGVDEPMDFAMDCPRCGCTPEWERDGRFSPRWRLNCCHVNDYAAGYLRGEEIDAVIAWNQACEIERERMEYEKHESMMSLRNLESDSWIDTHYPDEEAA